MNFQHVHGLQKRTFNLMIGLMERLADITISFGPFSNDAMQGGELKNTRRKPEAGFCFQEDGALLTQCEKGGTANTVRIILVLPPSLA